MRLSISTILFSIRLLTPFHGYVEAQPGFNLHLRWGVFVFLLLVYIKNKLEEQVGMCHRMWSVNFLCPQQLHQETTLTIDFKGDFQNNAEGK